MTTLVRVDSFRDDKTGPIPSIGSHQNSSVNVFLASTGPAEIQSPRHIRRSAC